jgi:hypothetical protein
MKKIFAVTLVAALALFAGSAYANFCARDVVPASTLLVPYAVVGMSGNVPDPAGYTTNLSVTNTSWEATIIHIVIWDALSNGVLDFDEVLSGYDVWTINFRDLLSGNWSAFDTSLSSSAPPNKNMLPLVRQTFEWGPDGRSAYDFVQDAPYYLGSPNAYATGLPFPQGTQSLSTANTIDCKMPFTNSTGASYAPLLVSLLQEPLYEYGHAGCAADQTIVRHAGDWLSGLTANPLFFYVTVDNFERCELTFPEDPGYFGTRGNYNYENVLIGEIYYMNSTLNFAEATPAVHIESDLDSELYDVTTEFYGDVTDDPTYLEPLATAFGFKYNNGGGWTSSVVVWKNASEFYDADEVLDCGSYLYYAWDEDEHVITRGVTCPVSPCGDTDIDPNEFPFETQMVPLTNANFDLPAAAGWMLLVFPPSYDDGPGTGGGFWHEKGDPTPDMDLLNFPYQAWVYTRLEIGTYSMGLEAATMAASHCFPEQRLPILGIGAPQWDGYDPAWYLHAGAAK